MKLAPKH